MEQTETERNGKKIGLKHGNGIFEHGTIKRQNKKKIFFDLFSTKMWKRNN